MWDQDGVADLVYPFAFASQYWLSARRAGGSRRYLQRNPERFEGLRQTCQGVLQGRSEGGHEGTLMTPPCNPFTVTDKAQTLYQEAVMWKRLAHPNIVSLLGITSAPLQLISE